MKYKKLVSALCAATLCLGFSQAAVVIPLTGTTIVPGTLISAQSTTTVGSGVGAIANVPPGTYNQAFFTFGSTINETSVSVNVGGFSSVWMVTGGNTLTTTSQSQVDSARNGLGISGPSGFTFTGSGGLPVGSSLQTLTFVPEPSSALLGAIGALMLLRRRR